MACDTGAAAPHLEETEVWSDDRKRSAYAMAIGHLEKFFEKYPAAELDNVARMSTINAFLKRYFPSWHFVGFYVVSKPGEMLAIGPYQGDVLATALIPFGKGQCGACAAEQATQIQADVSVCANYIPCDDFTRSEIVVPVFGRNGHAEPEAAGDPAATPRAAKKLIGVFDIDSALLGNFNEVDREHLEALMAKYF